MKYIQLTLFNAGDKGERVLIPINSIIAVEADNGHSQVHVSGTEQGSFFVEESYMSVRNRIDKSNSGNEEES